MARSTSTISVHTVNGRHDYFGENADRVHEEIERAIDFEYDWTRVIDISTKDGDGIVQFRMDNITTYAYIRGEEAEG